MREKDRNDQPRCKNGVSPLLKEDLDALRDAVRRLETQSFAVRTAQRGRSNREGTRGALPQKYSDIVQNAARQAIEKSLDVAINSLGRSAPMATGNAFHKLMAGASGAVGGFAALAVELPVSTTIMLRTIAEIARKQGEDLTTVEGRLACIEVFALDGRRTGDEAGYYAIRAGLAQVFREAAAQVAERGAARGIWFSGGLIHDADRRPVRRDRLGQSNGAGGTGDWRGRRQHH